jgi:transcriptional regulator with XRE-family HTH domain
MNTALIAARKSQRMTQEELAEALQAAAYQAGDNISVARRTVQRWEASDSTKIRPAHARALEAVTGLPIEELGFPPGKDAIVVQDGRGGHDLEVRTPPLRSGEGRQSAGTFSGIWLSRYEYFSSSRERMLASVHYVMLMQHGARLTARSLPGSADSTMGMDLTVDGSIVTGTWVEDTSKDGYYRGARYHGAIQLLADPSGLRLAGKWVGFGKDMEINTGPWRLDFEDASTSKATIAAYDRRPND